MPEIYLATKQAVLDIVPNLRPDDVDELIAAGLGDIESELIVGVESSMESFVAVVDREPVALFGLTHIGLAGFYSPWMVGTDYIDKHPLEALRLAKKIVKRWAERGPLVNYVSTHHETSRRWLEVLGFTVEKETILVGSTPFHRFSMGANYV